MPSIIACKTMLLTGSQAGNALRCSIEANPANTTEHTLLAPDGRRGVQSRLAFFVARRWTQSGAPLTVQFLDDPSVALLKRILLHINAWGEYANVLFYKTPSSSERAWVFRRAAQRVFLIN